VLWRVPWRARRSKSGIGSAMTRKSGRPRRPCSVQRIWAAHGLQPHRVKRFKLSKDPRFAAKLQDVFGLYIDPPAYAVVLSVDEKEPAPGARSDPAGPEMVPGFLPGSHWDYSFRRHRCPRCGGSP
jgi:hypothetical protein